MLTLFKISSFMEKINGFNQAIFFSSAILDYFFSLLVKEKAHGMLL